MPRREMPKIDPLDLILDRQFVMTDGKGRIDRIRDLYTTFNDKVDLQALKDGGYIEVVGKMMEPVTMSRDDHSPEVLAYWAKLGMVKEFHGENDPMSWSEYGKDTGYVYDPTPFDAPQNLAKRWNSFVPVSAFRPENAGRKYPCVVVLHGGFNPISIIDGWGWVQEAAKREWIVIVPSIEIDSVIEEILKKAEELYPVDRERIYACGFSYGGFMSNMLGNKRPDIFAAVAPCGAPIDNAYCGEAIGPEPQEPFDGVPRAIGLGTYMPVMNIYGALDGFRFPFYNYTGFLGRDGGPQDLVDGLNSWIRVNHGREVALSEVMAMKDRTDVSETEAVLGIPLEEGCGEKVERQGLVHHIASFPSEDGVVRTRLMGTMNMPHWPTPEMSYQAFEFFSHFSRNRETFESIYTA